MKYTAKPVTQYARNKTAASQSPAQSVGSGGSHEGAKKKAPPAAAAAPTAASAAPTSANSSQQNNSSTINDKVNKGGLSWNRSLTTSNSSGDANSLTNVSAPANDLGKAKGGRQASTAAEKSSYSDWVTKQISSGKQSAQHMADQGYISKDRVGEYAKHAPKPAASTSSKNFDSSRKETLTPDMTEAVAPKTQTQTRAHEKRSSNRQWITSNMGNRIAASSQIRRAKRDGLFANGELTDKGRSSLSPEQQKGLSGAYDTKRGRNADQLAHANRTGKWAHGGNTAVGESFETKAAKASEHATATGSEQEYTGDVSSTSASSSSNNSSSSSKSSAQGTNTKNNNTISIQRPVFNEPELFDGIGDNHSLRDIYGVGKYKMNRLHSSKSPAKMWNTDVSPAKEGETVRKHSPAGEAKMKKADKAAKNARWAAASPAKMWGPSKVKAGKGGFNRKK